MIRTTDIFSSCGYAGEFGGARRRASKSGSRGEVVRSGERKKGELRNEKKITTEFVSSSG